MRQVFGARVAGALLFAFCAAVAGGALAQQIPTPAPTPDNTGAGPQVQRQVEQPLNSCARVARGPLGRSAGDDGPRPRDQRPDPGRRADLARACATAISPSSAAGRWSWLFLTIVSVLLGQGDDRGCISRRPAA